MTQNETRIKLLIAVLFLIACGGTGTAPLSISVSTTGFLIAEGSIAFPDGDPCYSGQTIAAPRFTLSKMTTTWRGEGTVRPVYIKIKVKPSGNSTEATCTFSSTDASQSIAAALGFSTDDVSIITPPSISADSICSLICGSFSIKNKDASMFATGQVTLYGIQTKTLSSGERVENTVSAIDSFSLQYSP